jgi:hypothetical protein
MGMPFSKRCMEWLWEKMQRSVWTGPTFTHVVKEIFDCGDDDVILLFVALVRRIWFRRNTEIYEGHFAHPDTLIHQATKSVAAYASAQVCLSLRVSTAGNTGWKALLPGWFKLNWDAAIGKKLGITGIGVVARDCEGRVFAAKC